MILGIVGSEEAKFTQSTKNKAFGLIEGLLRGDNVTGYSSGHCHLGGIDIWTEVIGDRLKLESFIYAPTQLFWEQFRERNIKIAQKSDEVHCITLSKLPASYHGMKFNLCYHCGTNDHVKSGGCWTGWYALKLGKPAYLHIIGEDSIVERKMIK